MQTIVAAFDDASLAQRAIDSLIQNGFDRGSVHLQSGYSADSATSTTTTSNGTHDDDGFFAGVGRFFSNLFGDDETQSAHAGRYSEAVRRGSSVVVVDAKTDEQVEQATILLGDLGAIDIDERASDWSRQGWNGYDANSGPYQATAQTAAQTSLQSTATQTQQLDTEASRVMPVVQEELQVGKRTVERGGIRVLKRVTETPVSELVKLREERATIERRTVDRPATDADFNDFTDGTIEVRERSEEAVVGKTARVVEEVVVGKTVTERDETVSDTVRRTDVEVQTLEGDTTTTRAGDLRSGTR